MAGKSNQPVGVDKYDLLVSQRYVRDLTADNPLPLLLLCTVVVIAVLYWFFGTELGSGIRATGANPNMSRAQGINVDRNKVFGLMLSNGIVALSSALYSQYQGFTDVNAGRGAIVIGLAAVIIGEVLGEATLGKRLNFAGRLTFVVIGGVIYYIVYVFVLWLKFPADDMKLLTAIVVALFLSVPYLKGKYFTKSKFQKEGGKHA